MKLSAHAECSFKQKTKRATFEMCILRERAEEAFDLQEIDRRQLGKYFTLAAALITFWKLSPRILVHFKLKCYLR